MANFKVVIVSKDESFSMTPDDFASHDNVSCEIIKNNKEKLADIYNNYLRIERNNRLNDFLVFLHSDVKFDIANFIKNCERCKDKYDLIGLCGCEKIVISQSPFNWFTASNPYPNFRWGCVTHGELGNHKTFFSGDRADIRDHEVGMIDGLCIAFGNKALDSDLEFDNQFSFDQYDSDISFQALLNYKLKIGVIVEESLQHYSVGKSILQDEFLIHELDFRKKWNLDIPKGSRLEKLNPSTN